MRAAEQDRPDVAVRRRLWRSWQPFMDPERFVFIDETGASTNMIRRYGWAELPKVPPARRWNGSGGAPQRALDRCCATRALAHYDVRGGAEPVKVPPAKLVEYRRRVRSTGLVAPLVLDGPMNGSAFLAYVGQFLALTLRRGDVVVMDSLSAHKVAGVEDAIRATGASLLYLPPYSPDLIPIEQVFAKLRALLRGTAARTKEALWTTIGALIDRFRPAECRNYLTNSGYEFT